MPKAQHTPVKKLPNATRENFKVGAYKKVKGKRYMAFYSSNWNTATNPQPCKGLKVSSVNSDSVKLWTKIGCPNYRVFQYIGGEWKEIGKTTGTSYTVKKLTPQTEYRFKIRACKKDDKKKNYNHYGKHSKVVTVTTSVGKVTNEYVIYKDNGDNWAEVGRTANTQYTVENLNAETSYNFKVQAVKIDDAKVEHYGEESDVVTGTPSKEKKTREGRFDAMKAELTAYSREKAEYIKEHYTEFWKYGTDFNTLEEFLN